MKDIAAAKEYTDERLNYFKICYVRTDILAEGLRTIFKQEWDSRYKTTFGEWEDYPKNGRDFYGKESPRNQRRFARILSTMIKGNRAEWDSTMLFYAILCSDCIYSLNPVVRANVEESLHHNDQPFKFSTPLRGAAQVEMPCYRMPGEGVMELFVLPYLL